ncbi:transcription factor 25 [Apis mellifera caucasica]|uniref:Transcription factor 25 n=1 Tax=Apis mellifera TaxID=7460 RepID=A0A7M7MKG9_APIME|nr:transcription factor 25 [Apis mellifera]XP_006568636.1 transcription factor 25 [Apis mellifera]XP_006568637.1 transcription factor 25 [Apis mellifera]XP_026296470.1 transcription factor 25 [Apis mellifera]XP_026296471.1 transcription factor 25 [Apis mellifera]XP_393600.2 transcription factor 25 [Apis mellifera]KAG6797612.1 transcription factor 25 [Apis mellifera caucasica]KAG9437461.1 transcription factor 25 [Apis mellifera carnica]|eukprot:XP_006568635.1 transcription factor 25 [Apis mellifera]
MSTRYMKKVYGSDMLSEKDSENENEIDNSIIGNVKSKTFNLFDVLNQNSEISEEENEEEQVIDKNCINEVKRKKKKKRRKKFESSKVQIESKEEDVDEIERTVREVNKLLGEPLPSCSSQNIDNLQWIEQKSKEDILLVQHKHLNPYNELKRIFGSKTVQAEQNNRRNRGRLGHLKKTWLVSARDNWPPINKSGLSMSLDHTISSTNNIQYFIYDHSPSYRQIQLKFLEAVESLNPENIVSIINAHSYHVDALLQLAELCKLNEDLAMAAEFTERALYCLECAFHPLFNFTTALCRLDYKKQQNRALFITLFKHLNFVGGRACYRTSLEFCKLLLSLDPEGDPLAVILSLDFYALRAKEYEWFIEFCNLWDNTRNLTQLPNIAFSLALAHFHLGNTSSANELLQNALIMFPGVLIPLLEKCSIQSDKMVQTHNFFNTKAVTSTSPALEKLQNLYVVRNFRLWKETDLLPWLCENVHIVLNRVDSKDDYVKYCEIKRSKRYQGKLPRNILRHIILSDIKDITVNVQEVQNDGSVLSHDPLPPVDSIDIYKRPTTNTSTTRTNSNLLSLFFSSLFEDISGDVANALEGLNLLYDNNEQT